MKRPGPAVYPSAGRSCMRKGRSIDMIENVQELKEAYPLMKEMEAGKEVIDESRSLGLENSHGGRNTFHG